MFTVSQNKWKYNMLKEQRYYFQKNAKNYE